MEMKRIGHGFRRLALAALAMMACGPLWANYTGVLIHRKDIAPTTGSVTGLTIVVDFPVTNGQGKIVSTRLKQYSPTVKKADIEKMMNADNYTANGNSMSVKGFYRTASNGKFDYTNLVLDFIMVDHPYEYYLEDENLFLVEILQKLQNPSYLPMLRKLTRIKDEDDDNDIPSVNWNFAALTILMAGEAEGVSYGGDMYDMTSTFTYLLESHGYLDSIPEFDMGDGVQCRFKYFFKTYIGAKPHIGVVVHETGHMLFGFPDLYMGDGSGGGGVAEFSVMGHEDNFKPTNFDAYLRYRAGWVEPIEISKTEDMTLTLPADGKTVYKYTNPSDQTGWQYYLIENRQPTGIDVGLPGGGIVIYRIDESYWTAPCGTGGEWDEFWDGTGTCYIVGAQTSNNKSGLFSTNVYPNSAGAFSKGYQSFRRVFEVSIEQADGDYALEKSCAANWYADATDFWHAGNTAPRYEGVFYADGLCCAKWVDGTPAGIYLTDFSPTGHVMTCRSLAGVISATTIEIGQAVDELTSGESMGFSCRVVLSDTTVTNVTDEVEWSLADARDSDIAGFGYPNGVFYADYSKNGKEFDRVVKVRAKWTYEGQIKTAEASVTIHAKPRLANVWIDGPETVRSGEEATFTCHGSLSNGGDFTFQKVKSWRCFCDALSKTELKAFCLISSKGVLTCKFDKNATETKTYQVQVFAEAEYEGKVLEATNLISVVVVPKSSVFQIKFASNGGKVSPSSILVEAGTSILAAAPTPTRAKYRFTGWSTEKTGGEMLTEDVLATENATYYAQWEERTVTVRLSVEGDGSVSGVKDGAVCSVGDKITLRAAPGKRASFKYWSATPIDCWSPAGSVEAGLVYLRDYRQTPVTLTVPDADIVEITAYFIDKGQDSDIEFFGRMVGEPVTSPWCLEDSPVNVFHVRSASWPTVKASGVPAGVQFVDNRKGSFGTDYEYRLEVIDFARLKAGASTITLTAVNRSGAKATQLITVYGPNLNTAVAQGALSLATSAKTPYEIEAGVVLDWDRLGIAGQNGFSITKVSGLPAGLKWDAKAQKATGVPSKPGTYIVTFTAGRQVGKNKIESYSATATFVVKPLPDGVVGTFNGYTLPVSMEFGMDSRRATVTVAADGKVTAQVNGLGASALKKTGLEKMGDLYWMSLETTMKASGGVTIKPAYLIMITPDAEPTQDAIAGIVSTAQMLNGVYIDPVFNDVWIRARKSAFLKNKDKTYVNADMGEIAQRLAACGQHHFTDIGPGVAATCDNVLYYAGPGKGGRNEVTFKVDDSGVMTIAGEIEPEGSAKSIKVSDSATAAIEVDDQGVQTAVWRFFPGRVVIEIRWTLLPNDTGSMDMFIDLLTPALSGRAWLKK